MQETKCDDRISIRDQIQTVKSFTVEDEKTGEILIETRYKGSQNGKDWLIVYRMLFGLIATGKLSYAAVRTYAFIAAYQDWKGFYVSSKSALAEGIGITRKTLDSAIEELQARDMVRVARQRGSWAFYVNPDYVTQGRDKQARQKLYYDVPNAELLDDMAKIDAVVASF